MASPKVNGRIRKDAKIWFRGAAVVQANERAKTDKNCLFPVCGIRG
jgi:hypothetical protein